MFAEAAVLAVVVVVSVVCWEGYFLFLVGLFTESDMLHVAHLFVYGSSI